MNRRIKQLRLIDFNGVYDIKNNSMDIIRLLLAIIVIYGHTFPILYGTGMASPSGIYDFLAMFSKNQIGSGTVAVYMFFIISGFLITQSASNSKSNLEYLLKRVLRIVPALFISLSITVFVIGLIVTNYNIADYFHSSGNPIKYFFYNITFGIFGFYYSLADVFSSNPLPNNINASMWTLPHEVGCYLLIMILSTYNFIKKRNRMKLIYIISLIFTYYNIRFGYLPITLNDNFWLLSASSLGNFINLSYYFISGSLIYCYKDKIPYNKKIFITLLCLLLITLRIGYIKYSMLICLPYITLFICMLKPFINMKKIGDFSYGAYIYAFPIQQLLIFYLKDKVTFIQFFTISTFCILCISILSWFFIEKPALNLKKKLLN